MKFKVHTSLSILLNFKSSLSLKTMMGHRILPDLFISIQQCHWLRAQRKWEITDESHFCSSLECWAPRIAYVTALYHWVLPLRLLLPWSVEMEASGETAAWREGSRDSNHRLLHRGSTVFERTCFTSLLNIIQIGLIPCSLCYGWPPCLLGGFSAFTTAFFRCVCVCVCIW